jgi:hypothetical protein
MHADPDRLTGRTDIGRAVGKLLPFFVIGKQNTDIAT